MLRQSSIFQFKHGDHACIFYRSQNSLMEVLTPYVADGLRKGERCFGAQKPATIKQLYYDLRFLGIDVAREVKRGALDFHTEDEVYFPKGRFEPGVMLDMLMTSIDDALDQGFTGFRTAGDLSWAASGKTNCDLLVGYEKLVEKAYPGRTATGICQYSVNDFSPEMLEKVLASHKLHLEETEPTESHCSVQVRYGHCLVEIVANKFVVHPNYYYVVQQHRPSEVLGWGIAGDFDTASAEAEQIAQQTSAN